MLVYQRNGLMCGGAVFKVNAILSATNEHPACKILPMHAKSTVTRI